jgi:FkbM family methyltransferase
MAIRRLVEKLTQNWVLRRRLPRELGRGAIYVSPGIGGLRFLKPRLRQADPVLFSLVDELVCPGMTVWDVGANLGLFTFASARRAGPDGFVLAVEPDLDAVGLLQRSRARMDRLRNARVEVLPAAVFDGVSRLVELTIAARAHASNAVTGYGHSQMGGVREKRLVPAFALDELLLEHRRPPNLVKIDIEGAEAAALAAAVRLLSAIRPTLVVEVSSENAREVGRILGEADYRVFDAASSKRSRRLLELPAWNTLAIPASRV